MSVSFVILTVGVGMIPISRHSFYIHSFPDVDPSIGRGGGRSVLVRHVPGAIVSRTLMFFSNPWSDNTDVIGHRNV